MPTKKKRVGFIPREDVMKIIDKLSTENNLSNSKIINILVEEALSLRGWFNKKTGKVSKTYLSEDDQSQVLTKDPGALKGNHKYQVNNKLENHKNSYITTLSKDTYHEDFDLQTYKKFLSFLKFQEMMDEYNS